MPTYEYECRTCGYTFERVQNMSDEPVRICPECGQAVRRLIFGGSGVIFKGSGFYVNDSKAKNSAAPKADKVEAAKPADGKVEATPAPEAAKAPEPAKPTSSKVSA